MDSQMSFSSHTSTVNYSTRIKKLEMNGRTLLNNRIHNAFPAAKTVNSKVHRVTSCLI